MRPVEHFPFITPFDLKRLLNKHRQQVVRAAVGLALFVLSVYLCIAPKYVAEATFQQSAKQNDISLKIKEMFQQFSSIPSESAAMVVMQSNAVLKKTVEELGLQARVKTRGPIARLFTNVYENCIDLMGGTLTDREEFVLRDVRYHGEEPLHFFIQPTGGDAFQILTSDKKVIGHAQVGHPFSHGHLHMTIARSSKGAGIGRNYPLKVVPWQEALGEVRSHLRVRKAKMDSSLLTLTYESRDRHLAAAFLNHLMVNYQYYLKLDNEEICQAQLRYLEKRQDELTGRLDNALIEHVAYLEKSLSEDGHIGLTQELESLSLPRDEYLAKLLDVDLKIKRLEPLPLLGSEKEEKKGKKKKTSSEPYAQVREDLQSQKRKGDLHEQRLERGSVIPLQAEMEQTQKQLREVHLACEAIEKNRALPDLEILTDPKGPLAHLTEPLDRASLLSYLRDYLVHLTQKRDMLAEDVKLKQKGDADFIGLDLNSSRQFWENYTAQRDACQAQLRELIFLRERLSDPSFELSSTGAVFSDAVTNDLLHKASALSLQLEDDQNRSQRDQQRLHEALQTQKKFLSQHLFQTIELTKLRSRLIEDKIEGLRHATLSLLHSEKDLLDEKLHEINDRMKGIPEKWRRENLLMLKRELGMRMIEAMTQLTESKNIGQHLYQVSSKTLDAATPPLKTKNSYLFLMLLFAPLFGGGGVYFFYFCRMLIQGVPVSAQQLKQLGYPVVGELSRYSQTPLREIGEPDLETLRNLADRILDGGRLVALTLGRYPDFTRSLAELLVLRGKKVVLVHFVFDAVVRPEDKPGLWQYLNAETDDIPLRSMGSYDMVPSGGTTRYGS